MHSDVLYSHSFNLYVTGTQIKASKIARTHCELKYLYWLISDLAETAHSFFLMYGPSVQYCNVLFQFASLVSLSGKGSYLRYVESTAGNLQLTLKFKTSRPDGRLFLYVTKTQTTAMPDSISLSLINGTSDIPPFCGRLINLLPNLVEAYQLP